MTPHEHSENPLDAIIDATKHTREWLDGFEVGILYVLMGERVPHIAGVCARNNEEIIFALAGKCGYTWEWNPRKGNEQSDVCFTQAHESDD